VMMFVVVPVKQPLPPAARVQQAAKPVWVSICWKNRPDTC
jgi:hypothetical protein